MSKLFITRAASTLAGTLIGEIEELEAQLAFAHKQLAVMRDALLSVIECDGIMGCETVDLALEALARCKELENE